MARIVRVTRAQVAAARLRVKSDLARGRTPDPRYVKIANARRLTGTEAAARPESAPSPSDAPAD